MRLYEWIYKIYKLKILQHIYTKYYSLYVIKYDIVCVIKKQLYVLCD